MGAGFGVGADFPALGFIADARGLGRGSKVTSCLGPGTSSKSTVCATDSAGEEFRPFLPYLFAW